MKNRNAILMIVPVLVASANFGLARSNAIDEDKSNGANNLTFAEPIASIVYNH